MGILDTIGRLFKAKSAQVSAAIEQENAIEFSRQDIEKMKADKVSISTNVATICAEIDALDRKISDAKAKIAKHDKDAMALQDAGQIELAEKHCQLAETLEVSLASLESSRTLQVKLKDDQKALSAEIEQDINTYEAELVSMQAMADVAKANNSLSSVSTSGGALAKANFERRKEMMQKNMVKSQVLKAEGSSSLEAETAAALGTSAGSSRLSRLKEARTVSE